MTEIKNCIYCKENNIVKNGQLKSGGQRFRCRDCKHDFSLGGSTSTYSPEFKNNICIQFLHNHQKVRQVAKQFGVSTSTIINRAKGHKQNCKICN